MQQIESRRSQQCTSPEVSPFFRGKANCISLIIDHGNYDPARSATKIYGVAKQYLLPIRVVHRKHSGKSMNVDELRAGFELKHAFG
ncbi:hypothetical protein D7U91_05175 [Stenotrophomonas maltophilia]|nr:hypothetical protein [Stenotrophomonas maltophilia]MBA0391259.1 hypothetical protein [Stenotrophomonas maltophilia]MBA0463845.1 hypothetical protein [Stenotrophomonas maltophilia]MBA0472407.1 hypothetical protein [Stenotrophomonas maltophilia]